MFILFDPPESKRIYDQFQKKKGYQVPPIVPFWRWLGRGRRSLASTISANKESKKMKNRHGKYPLKDDLICDFLMIAVTFI